MKATELRIGNYIDYETEREIVTMQITYEYIRLIHNGNKNFKPIELTKEWLLKFGFEKTYDDFNWYIKGNYCFSFLKELDLIVFKIKFQTVDICTIKYVHQAQNIYFALTGEELSL